MSKHTWITVDFHDEETYHSLLDNSQGFTAFVMAFIISACLALRHKPGCPGGCSLTRHSHYERKKLNGLPIWRVQCKLCGAVFTVLPHFVLPYRAISADTARQNLLGYYRGLSLDASEEVCGGISAEALFRLICALGREGTVPVLIKADLPLPDYFEADEKHSSCEDNPLYLTTVSAGEVIWSLACCENKTAAAFTEGYGVFQQATLEYNPDWQPKGILCDGYDSTVQAQHALFPKTPVGACLRHAVAGLGKKLKGLCGDATKLCRDFWHLFDGRGEGLIPVFSLGQKLRRFAEQVEKTAGEEVGGAIRRWIARHKDGWFAVMRDPNLPLTSVMLDQRHNYLDRKLFMMKGFHHAGIDRQAFLNGLV